MGTIKYNKFIIIDLVISSLLIFILSSSSLYAAGKLGQYEHRFTKLTEGDCAGNDLDNSIYRGYHLIRCAKECIKREQDGCKGFTYHTKLKICALKSVANCDQRSNNGYDFYSANKYLSDNINQAQTTKTSEPESQLPQDDKQNPASSSFLRHYVKIKDGDCIGNDLTNSITREVSLAECALECSKRVNDGCKGFTYHPIFKICAVKKVADCNRRIMNDYDFYSSKKYKYVPDKLPLIKRPPLLTDLQDPSQQPRPILTQPDQRPPSFLVLNPDDPDNWNDIIEPDEEINQPFEIKKFKAVLGKTFLDCPEESIEISLLNMEGKLLYRDNDTAKYIDPSEANTFIMKQNSTFCLIRTNSKFSYKILSPSRNNNAKYFLNYSGLKFDINENKAGISEIEDLETFLCPDNNCLSRSDQRKKCAYIIDDNRTIIKKECESIYRLKGYGDNKLPLCDSAGTCNKNVLKACVWPSNESLAFVGESLCVNSRLSVTYPVFNYTLDCPDDHYLVSIKSGHESILVSKNKALQPISITYDGIITDTDKANSTFCVTRTKNNFFKIMSITSGNPQDNNYLNIEGTRFDESLDMAGEFYFPQYDQSIEDFADSIDKMKNDCKCFDKKLLDDITKDNSCGNDDITRSNIKYSSEENDQMRRFIYANFYGDTPNGFEIFFYKFGKCVVNTSSCGKHDKSRKYGLSTQEINACTMIFNWFATEKQIPLNFK